MQSREAGGALEPTIWHPTSGITQDFVFMGQFGLPQEFYHQGFPEALPVGARYSIPPQCKEDTHNGPHSAGSGVAVFATLLAPENPLP